MQLWRGCNVITVFEKIYSGPDRVRGFFLPFVAETKKALKIKIINYEENRNKYLLQKAAGRCFYTC